MSRGRKPSLPSSSENELIKAQESLERFESEVKSLTLDEMNKAPVLEEEPQTKLSQKEIDKSKDVYLKPKRSIHAVHPKTGKGEVFNEKYREEYNFKKEYVHFTAENKEIGGEAIELWTKPFTGVPAEEWHVPVNKPVWAPRYVAERIKNCTYHRLIMEDRVVSQDGQGSYFGQMVAKNTVQRLDAHPVSEKKSIFMGASNF